MDIPRILWQISARDLRKERSNHLNRNTDRSGKGGFSRGKSQRNGIPLAAIGRKISQFELVSEKLEKQERKKAEKVLKNPASVSKKANAEAGGKQEKAPHPSKEYPAPNAMPRRSESAYYI